MPQKDRFLLLTLMLGTFMAAIDSSIVNVSLPVIRNQFGVSLTSIEWVITAYMISFTLFIPMTNWLKKRIGYFHLFVYSVALFTLGSFLCGLSHSLTSLILSRILQALGGGAISPTSLAILSENYPAERRGNAIGWWGIGNVMGPTLGPTLGGLLTHYFGWHSIFFVNIPVGIITILFTFRYLGFLKQQPVFKINFDILGYIYFALFVVAMQFAISSIADYGFPSWQLPVAIISSLITIYLFILSSKKENALLDLSVFKLAVFNKALIVIIIRSLALYGGMFFLPFLLQGILGYTPIQTGLIMLPNALMMLITRPMAGKLADRGYIRNTSLLGIVMVAISFVLFSNIGLATSLTFILVSMLIRGTGMSLLVSPVSTALLNAVKLDQSATATSLNALLQQFGGSIGIAVSGVIHTFIYNHYLQHYKAPFAEHYALRDSFLISGFVIALAIIPALGLPEKAAIKSATVIGE
jgi:MFS transporter, DHA2 family, multidrug resistance protein